MPDFEDDLAAAKTGDDLAFGRLVERHRRELHVHCYRLLGSFDEAEDLVQETFLRAWNKRDSFDGGPLFRAWLYRIATNACLDAIRRSKRRVPSLSSSFAEIPWLQPYPDRLLDEIAPRTEEPDAVVVARETIELAFLAIIQLLPPRQRAVLVLRDVLDWSAADTASALEISVASVNSALQRARATLREQQPAHRVATPSDQERALLLGFIDAHERADADAAIAMMREDIRITMPPLPLFFEGREKIADALVSGLKDPGDWRLVPIRANRMPAAASYLRKPGDTEFRAFKLDVLRIEGGLVAEVTTFGESLFPAFGLPPTLDPAAPRSTPVITQSFDD
ncbi:RNA polymerase subunit sigma-70 [Actinomadura scrupuli]|uniref:RNA polymerase subunit sigma-70 n=1 Tax=Actinomadura scrupuli TaxID=559629 RepID=UPI003D953168